KPVRIPGTQTTVQHFVSSQRPLSKRDSKCQLISDRHWRQYNFSFEPVMSAQARLVLAEQQWMFGDEYPSREMKKQRRGKTDGIHAVQDSAVPFNGAAKILHAAVTLDGRHCQPSGKSHKRHSQ